MSPDSSSRRRRPLALVTGATGYIGGRLIPELLQAGYRVRVIARTPAKLRDKPWAKQVTVVEGDATDPAVLAEGMRNAQVAYYLLHSLSPDPSFEEQEAHAARVFAAAARDARVKRIVYLGGLIDPHDEDLSPHLRSRAHVGQILRDSGVPTVELRAAVILGSGSASFEMLRYLTERLPVMTTPTWVRTRIQPIAIRDVLYYLVNSATLPAEVNRSFDIGGPDVLTYEQMMRRYAAATGLRTPTIIPVPVLSPGLSSHWVGFITPVPASIARPLVESVRHEVICREQDIKEFIPDPPGGLTGFDQAVKLAVRQVQDATVATRWSEASVPSAPSDPWPGDPAWAGGSLYTDTRHTLINASPEQVWRVVESIGGENGWYSWRTAWRVRGALDRMVGGVGLRRGRRNPRNLDVGDALDFWRVEECVDNKLLRLRAEMKLPGLAWLEFTLTPTKDGRTVLTQRALFHPSGTAGHAYWASIYPFHAFVFGPMIKNIARAAERQPAEAQAASLSSSSSTS